LASLVSACSRKRQDSTPPDKYEHPYPYEYATVLQLQEGLRGYFAFYNCERLDQSLSYRTRPQGYLVDVACPAERKSFTCLGHFVVLTMGPTSGKMS
jgi:hypothetical protein